ncbi:hypothetical protein AURDEDRAFT_168838 [Auricularia subglabra TFB-10046 SS5]|nr:hypothetical protein AURDEDRAFT_168838 [Auricularia subglabra TFB-10046 SS5]
MASEQLGGKDKVPWYHGITPGILLALVGTAVNGLAAWCGNDDGRCAVPTKDALTLGGGTLFALFGFFEAITPDTQRGWSARRNQLISGLDGSPCVVSAVLIASAVYGVYDLARTAANHSGNEVDGLAFLIIRCLTYFGMGIPLLIISRSLELHERTWSEMFKKLKGRETAGSSASGDTAARPEYLELVWRALFAGFICGTLLLTVIRRPQLAGIAKAVGKYTGWHAGRMGDLRDGLLVTTIVVLVACLAATVYTIMRARN